MEISQSPSAARSWSSDIAREKTVWLKWTDPICCCVVVSHTETDEPAEAATNVPLLARAMHLTSLVLWMVHLASVVPVKASRE